MAFKLIWSPSAQLDVNDIVVFIGEDSPTDAKRFVLRLFKAAERLADCPDPAKFAPAVTMAAPLFVQGIKYGVPGIPEFPKFTEHLQSFGT